MTPDRLRECLTLIGWSGRSFAERAGIYEHQVRRMAAGATIPEPIAAVLEALAAAHAAHPFPPPVDRRFIAADAES